MLLMYYLLLGGTAQTDYRGSAKACKKKKEAFSTLFHNSNKTCLLASYFAEEIQATHKNSWIFLRAISPTFVHIFKENNNLPLR